MRFFNIERPEAVIDSEWKLAHMQQQKAIEIYAEGLSTGFISDLDGMATLKACFTLLSSPLRVRIQMLSGEPLLKLRPSIHQRCFLSAL
ncbi:MAG: hypothetical protein AAF202_13120 [Pseudomonadota bacterium]